MFQKYDLGGQVPDHNTHNFCLDYQHHSAFFEGFNENILAILCVSAADNSLCLCCGVLSALRDSKYLLTSCTVVNALWFECFPLVVVVE